MEWIESKNRFPPSGINVIAYGVNSNGKGRTIRAFYAPRWTIQDDDLNNGGEYNEEEDEFYLKEGWYESNECEDVHWMVNFIITHWMPLPAGPGEKKLF